MSYSNLYLRKNQRTLYILGILSLVSLVMGGLFFLRQFGQKNGWQKVAGIETLYVINRSPHGFEVVWSTNNPVKESQWVEVGTTKKDYPIISKLENVTTPYHAIITGLEPDTQYYFRVRIGEKTYILPSINYDEVRTPKEVKEKPISPAYGKVILPSTKPYMNGLLIYEIDGFYPLGIFTKQTGEWLLPLTGLIEKKSNTITTVSDATPVLIKLFSYPNGTIRTFIRETHPLKQAIIAGTSVHLAQTTQRKGESILGVATQNSILEESNISSIIYPKENALIPGNTPLIRGTAPAGKDALVLIQGSNKQYSYRTKANEKGEWLVQNPILLEPGRYTIVFTIKNGTGVSTIVKRTFTIIKSGEQVLGVATGSPTLVPTAPIVPTYASPTVIPTTISLPTSTPIISQYPSPTVIPTQLQSTAAPPVTGGGVTNYLFGALLFIVVGAGLVLAF